jgi:hypothetical protein
MSFSTSSAFGLNVVLIPIGLKMFSSLQVSMRGWYQRYVWALLGLIDRPEIGE